MKSGKSLGTLSAPKIPIELSELSRRYTDLKRLRAKVRQLETSPILRKGNVEKVARAAARQQAAKLL